MWTRTHKQVHLDVNTNLLKFDSLGDGARGGVKNRAPISATCTVLAGQFYYFESAIVFPSRFGPCAWKTLVIVIHPSPHATLSALFRPCVDGSTAHNFLGG